MRAGSRHGGDAVFRPSAAMGVFRVMLRAAVAVTTLPASAIELPPPDRLAAETGMSTQTVEVVEPHMSRPGHELRVAYRGFEMSGLLDRLFGDRWKATGTEVVFFARDGYRSSTDSRRFVPGSAWLAFGRADSKPFTVDNPGQHETGVSLGPYYLVWDNLRDSAARAQGAYGWPYQVVRIDLATPADYAAARPQDSDPVAVEGFEQVRKYCLTCHQVAGIGGGKFPGDLRQIAGPLSDRALKTWITEPQKMHPGTTMPPLNALLPEAERDRATDAIIRYLRMMPVRDGTTP
ncbi:c-type cytochrome [Methylococcus capsulatus]|uniref:c-type cytochrome n=1 Tax=Methylococcus capsulatus TaxID=414 RepID=UPI00211ABCAC|nr:cytochrome c [Methylococcus capsulatus]